LKIPFKSIVIFSVLSFVVGLSIGMFATYPSHFQAYLRENYGVSSLSELNRILSPHLQMRESYSLNELTFLFSQTVLAVLLISTRFWKNDKHRLSRKILLTVVFVGFIGGCFSGDRVSLVSAQSATYVVNPEGAFVKDFSYLIYTLNGNVYAVNGLYGTTPYKGSVAETVINDVLANGLTAGRTWKERVLLKGNFSLSGSIKISSYTILQIDGKLTMTTDANMIENSDQTNGNVDIEIIGGVLDGNNRDVYIVTTDKVTNFFMRNVKVINGKNAALYLNGDTNNASHIWNNVYSNKLQSDGYSGTSIMDIQCTER